MTTLKRLSIISETSSSRGYLEDTELESAVKEEKWSRRDGCGDFLEPYDLLSGIRCSLIFKQT